MSEFIVQSTFFGVVLSFFAYMLFYVIKEKCKIKTPLFNPLLLSSTLIIVLLSVTGIEFEDFNRYAEGTLTYWLTPVTICLAIPLYRRVKELKNNLPAILISIFFGCLGHVFVLVGIGACVKLSPVLLHSVMPKSVTTAIALALSEKIGGIPAVTVACLTVAGMSGAVLGPTLLKWFKIKEPVAQGLAIGTASHAVGTSKAMELGEIQGAMSSLAIVVTGILTVIVVPVVTSIFG